MSTKNHYNVCALILAKGQSKRLAEKNIYPLNGKPLISWTIEAAKKSKYISDIFVSTESEKVRGVVNEHNVNIIDRPYALTIDKNDSAPTPDC